jgi:hypothetical protein
MPDPPGSNPWLIYGTLLDYLGDPLVGVTITATNLTTAETQTCDTDASGQYMFDCDAPNFASGYSDGDIITITCTYDNSLCVIDTDLSDCEVNLQESPPVPPAPTSGYAPVWSYGRSVIAQSVDYWSYGESGHYRLLGGGAPIVSVTGTSTIGKLVASGLI